MSKFETEKLKNNSINKHAILKTEKLGIDFGGLTAVDDFSISVRDNEIFGLIGPNGAGKTTIFNLLTNVYHPTRGSIILNDINTEGKSTEQVNKLGIARTFQNIRLFYNMTVLDNVKIGMHNSLKSNLISSFTHGFGFSKIEKEAEEKAVGLLKYFNMEHMSNYISGSLPYGAQRRLEIIRAIATNPKIMLLDEPAAGMNPSETAELMENIYNIRDTFNIGIILIEHDMNLVMNICENIAVLNYGKIIAKGTPPEIKSNDIVIEAYLGKKAV